MKQNLSTTSAIIVCLMIAAAATKGWADCGRLSGTITNLPPLAGYEYQVSGLNAAGQIAGSVNSLAGDSGYGFLYSAGTLQNLGTLGGSFSAGLALNASGEVAGNAANGDGASHATLFDGVNLLDLGTLGGSVSSSTAVNDHGAVAGLSFDAGDAVLEAFLYSGGSLLGLGTLGGTMSTASALNNSGIVVGLSTVADGNFHGYLYDGTGMHDIGTLGGAYSAAYDLNDAGVVVGEAGLTNGEVHAFVYANGLMTDCGTFGGRYSGAYYVNQSGQAVGLSSTSGEEAYHGFLFSDGTLTDLGTLGGVNTFPSALNNLGQIVGQSEMSGGALHAFLWQNGTMLDLNSLLAANAGWELQQALFINDAGRVVGTGLHDGLPECFILDISAGNNPPIAVAGPDQTVQCPGQVVLDGSLSSDPDGDTLAFEWSVGGNVLGTSVTLSTFLPLGTNTVALRVTDPCGASNQTTVFVVVTDTTPPVITSLPGPVTVSVGANCQGAVPNVLGGVAATDACSPANQLVMTQTPAAGTLLTKGQYSIVVTVTDASGNSDSQAVPLNMVDTTPPVITSLPGPVTVSVGANCQGAVPNVLGGVAAMDGCTPASQLVMTQTPAAGTLLAKGQYSITVKVTDASGNSTSQAIPLSMVDTTPPVIQSVTVNPSVLSPPNHQLMPVTVTVVASDGCGGAVTNRIISITANEPTSAGDIRITGNLTATLAASRAGANDRVYTIGILSTDSSGNSSTGSVTVTVPHDKGKK